MQYTKEMLLGNVIKINSVYYPDSSIAHRESFLFMFKNENSAFFDLISSFVIVPGLAGAGISFKSKDYPDYYIVNKDNNCMINRLDNSELAKNMASWLVKESLDQKSHCSFQSVSDPGFYMMRSHSDTKIITSRYCGEDNVKKDSSWNIKIVKKNQIQGEWKLIYGNNNSAADWEWTEEVSIGTEFIRSESTSTSSELSWKSSLEAESKFWGLSVKAMIEAGGLHSVNRTSSNTWTQTQQEKTTIKFSGKKGEPFYLWQYNYHLATCDDTVVSVASDLFAETDSFNNIPDDLN